MVIKWFLALLLAICCGCCWSFNIRQIETSLRECSGEPTAAQENNCLRLKALKNGIRQELMILLRSGLGNCCSCEGKSDWDRVTAFSPPHLGDRVFLFNPEPLDWFGARKRCRELSGDLIHTGMETRGSRSRILSHFAISRDYIWMGLNDNWSEGEWMWVNGTALVDGATFGWGERQPNGGAAENCALLYTIPDERGGGGDQFNVYDYPCRLKRTYQSICEMSSDDYTTIITDEN